MSKGENDSLVSESWPFAKGQCFCGVSVYQWGPLGPGDTWPTNRAPLHLQGGSACSGDIFGLFYFNSHNHLVTVSTYSETREVQGLWVRCRRLLLEMWTSGFPHISWLFLGPHSPLSRSAVASHGLGQSYTCAKPGHHKGPHLGDSYITDHLPWLNRMKSIKDVVTGGPLRSWHSDE